MRRENVEKRVMEAVTQQLVTEVQNKANPRIDKKMITLLSML